jgi:hypothetical protein
LVWDGLVEEPRESITGAESVRFGGLALLMTSGDKWWMGSRVLMASPLD